MKSKKPHKKRKWTSEEIEEAKDKHWEKMIDSGSTMSPEEWDKLMNYYDDKKYLDEIFDKMDTDKIKKSINK